MFPINGPTWSLFFEVAIDLFYAALARVLTLTSLAGIIAVSLAWLVYATISASTIGSLGVYYEWAWSGIPRTSFSFVVGVALYRLYEVGRLPTIKMHPLILAASLLAVFLPSFNNGTGNIVFELACVTIIFPLIIAAGSQSRPEGWLVGVATLSGALSYPIYVLHMPFLLWYEHLSLLPGRTTIIAAALIVPPISYLVLKYFDEPLRRLLSRALRRAVEPNVAQPSSNEPAVT
ncbi:hypothetical protein UB31_11665 [Bradyrhizobium sp. LTSP849]|uniref:acyltransferase family protein n=1 Tax=Bradyrhizobium sp. LTSP849 TaxID=1615890 RepID=UPI0005D1FEAB|nr:acyltransferase family protein [Bradyrhizobium sp. LTSP849]KJC50887.1 hypothetical protein UB31_11665 [Bradyrhizobium sp. LTSP849]